MIHAGVAIITRTKNRDLLLRRAVESVLNQTFSDWAMVIVNDGGAPEAIDKLVSDHAGEFKGRVKVIHNEVSVGMEAASNIGIKSSSSKYIAIHDDDDTWEPGFLRETLNFLEQRQARGVITHSRVVIEKIGDNGIQNIVKLPFNDWLVHVSIYNMAAQNMFPPISFIYEREVLDKIGVYDESLPVLGDWDFNIRFIEEYDIHVLPRFLANYHQRPASLDEFYSNTVCDIDKLKLHFRYTNQLRNAYLRRDMQRNKFGMGFLMNVGFSTEYGFRKSDEQRRTLMTHKDGINLGIQANIDRFETEYKGKNIYFYGGGGFLNDLISCYDLSKLDVKGVFDLDHSKAGGKIGDYTVYHSSTMNEHNIDVLIFTMANPVPVLSYVSCLYGGFMDFIAAI